MTTDSEDDKGQLIEFPRRRGPGGELVRVAPLGGRRPGVGAGRRSDTRGSRRSAGRAERLVGPKEPAASADRAGVVARQEERAGDAQVGGEPGRLRRRVPRPADPQVRRQGRHLRPGGRRADRGEVGALGYGRGRQLHAAPGRGQS